MAREASEQAVLCANVGALLALDPNLEDMRHAGGNRILLANKEPRALVVALRALRASTWPAAANLGDRSAGPRHRDSRNTWLPGPPGSEQSSRLMFSNGSSRAVVTSSHQGGQLHPG